MKKGSVVKGLLIFLAVALIGIGAMKITRSSYTTGNAVQDITTPAGETKEFNVKAFRFGYEPNSITLNEGDKVKIIINNTDTLHGMTIPQLGISGDNVIEFVADKKGEFDWYCNVFCGKGHGSMGGRLIVR